MLFLIVLCLAVAAGKGSEYYCDSEVRPNCMELYPLPEEATKIHHDSGNMFPSNEFFQETCPRLLEIVKCGRGLFNMCPEKFHKMDLNLAVDTLAEFCDEETDFRKGYVANVDCFNRMNIENSSCWLSFRDKMMKLLREEKWSRLVKSAVSSHCLYQLGLRPCAVDLAENTCGEESRDVINGILNRVTTILKCSERDAEILEELLATLIPAEKKKENV